MQADVRFLIHELVTPDTRLLAESYGRVSQDLDGDGDAPDYVPLNDVPHTWAHAYLYAAAMIAFGSR